MTVPKNCIASSGAAVAELGISSDLPFFRGMRFRVAVVAAQMFECWGGDGLSYPKF